jgi:hypothetical protein
LTIDLSLELAALPFECLTHALERAGLLHHCLQLRVDLPLQFAEIDVDVDVLRCRRMLKSATEARVTSV